MRYMREQLAHEIESDNAPRRTRHRSTAKKLNKAQKNASNIVPYLAVAPDATVYLALPDSSMRVPDTSWHPSSLAPSAAQAPDALLPTGSPRRPSHTSLPRSRRAIDVLGLSPHFSPTSAAREVGELPKDLGWTWASLDIDLVPWWPETFGEKCSKEGRGAATSRLRRLLVQQHNITQLEKTLASMVDPAPDAESETPPALVRSQSSCTLQRQRPLISVAVTGRRAFSNNSSPCRPGRTLAMHIEGDQEVRRDRDVVHEAISAPFTSPSASVTDVVES